MSQFQPRELVSTPEAARLLGEHTRTVQRRAQSGAYPSYKLPGATGAYVFDRAELEAIAAERAAS